LFFKAINTVNVVCEINGQITDDSFDERKTYYFLVIYPKTFNLIKG